LAGAELVEHLALGGEHADVVDLVAAPGGHHQQLVVLADLALHHPHQADHAMVVVEPGVDDQRLQLVGVARLRRRDAGDDRLQHLLDVEAGLGADRDRLGGVDADHRLDLGLDPVHVGGRQVDLVEHRHHFQALLHRGVAVGHGLGLDALGGVHHQQRALAGGQRAADLVAEVHVAGGVDEVEVVGLAVARGVRQRHRLRLDGDAALALDRVVVEHLLFHLARGQAAAELDDAVGQGRLAVVDVGDDREVANVPHLVRGRGSARTPGPNAGLSHGARESRRERRSYRTGTAMNWALPRRLTSSITVSPFFTPARALSSAAGLPTGVRPTCSTTSPGRRPARRASAPSTRVMATPSDGPRSSAWRVRASSGSATRPSGLSEAFAGAAGAAPGRADGASPASSSSSSGASTTFTVRGLPSRRMPSSTRVPGAIAPMIGGSSLERLMARPSTLRTTSPGARPAFSPGLPGVTLRISAPRLSGRPIASTISEVIGWRPTPIIPYWTLPVALSCCTAFIARSTGMAKLTPM